MKRSVFIIPLILMIFLSACASPAALNTQAEVPQSGGPTSAQQDQNPVSTTSSTAPAQAVPSVTLNASYENAASVELQLLVGTLKLEETNLSITKDQASTLLPLWQQIRTKSQSMAPVGGQGNGTAQPQSDNSSSQEQVEALVNQIQSAMTSDQIKAIADMKITKQSSMTLIQTLGITMGGHEKGNGNNSRDGNPPPMGNLPSNGSGPRQSNNAPPSDGQPSDRGSMPGNDQGNGQMAGPSPSGNGMVPPELIDAVIQALAKISGIQLPDSSAQNPPQPAGSDNTSQPVISAAYTVDGNSVSQTNQTYSASDTDESAVYVNNKGTLTLKNSSIATSGSTSSNDNSSFHGLNAAVLAANSSTLNFSDSTVTTTGSGANGVFATDSGTSIKLTNVTIKATGNGGHAVMATNGGSMTIVDTNMDTAGTNSGAIATDRGGGTISVTGGNVTTSGQDSPGIYSTGNITVSWATISASGAEAAVIEGANSITLMNTSLSSSKEGKWGVMIYQSFSGDAKGSNGTYSMTGGSLAYTSKTGPLFYITNSTGKINLKGVNVLAGSGTLLEAGANSRWGKSGSNGGSAILTADGQTLKGNLVADDIISSLATKLQNGSSLTGSINPTNKAKSSLLTLDYSSSWNVTEDSHLTCLSDAGGIFGSSINNITGNGHSVTYNQTSCSALNGMTYTLSGGGILKPGN